ncbi:MAG: class I SAM-dependent methyltransferase [Candidatus Dormibacteraeota bacterium]|nr:class I SAM-dependent methyltransferase [Candidatus Dormibacteraeota bacterium]
MTRYSPDRVRRFYDHYGEAEWGRFDRNVASRVGLEIHTRFLRRWVHSGDRVLEAGAGPGRFTIELAELGTRIVVGDISPQQLALNAEKVAASGREDAVEARRVLDIVDLSQFRPSSFDVVTAYGGPLSYVFDRVADALTQLLRVVRPGGIVLFSVMSRWGSLHQFLDGVIYEVAHGSAGDFQHLVETGDQLGEAARSTAIDLPHEMHLFTWAELQHLLATQPCRVVDVSAANFLSVRSDKALDGLLGAAWERFLDWEEQACREPGAIDAGTHILVALEKTPDST